MANILVNNIYHMLAYAFQVLHQSNYEKISTEPFDNLMTLPMLGVGLFYIFI